jgi:hypothetical protein
MKNDVTHILTSLKKECERYGKGHLEIRKIQIKDENIFNTVGFCILKKTVVKSVICLSCSYQTGYIMWHSRIMIYIPWGVYSENKRGIYFSPQKRLKDGWRNITLHWINGIIRNNKCILTKLESEQCVRV